MRSCHHFGTKPYSGFAFTLTLRFSKSKSARDWDRVTAVKALGAGRKLLKLRNTDGYLKRFQ